MSFAGPIRLGAPQGCERWRRRAILSSSQVCGPNSGADAYRLRIAVASPIARERIEGTRLRIFAGVNDLRLDPAARIVPGDLLSVRSGVELRMKNQFIIFKQASPCGRTSCEVRNRNDSAIMAHQRPAGRVRRSSGEVLSCSRKGRWRAQASTLAQ